MNFSLVFLEILTEFAVFGHLVIRRVFAPYLHRPFELQSLELYPFFGLMNTLGIGTIGRNSSGRKKLGRKNGLIQSFGSDSAIWFFQPIDFRIFHFRPIDIFRPFKKSTTFCRPIFCPNEFRPIVVQSSLECYGSRTRHRKTWHRRRPKILSIFF
jgi:hypothetical protein